MAKLARLGSQEKRKLSQPDSTEMSNTPNDKTLWPVFLKEE